MGTSISRRMGDIRGQVVPTCRPLQQDTLLRFTALLRLTVLSDLWFGQGCTPGGIDFCRGHCQDQNRRNNVLQLHSC